MAFCVDLRKLFIGFIIEGKTIRSIPAEFEFVQKNDYLRLKIQNNRD